MCPLLMLCVIWYHLHDLKNVKNIHGWVLLSVKLQTLACNFNKIITPPCAFFTFLNLYKWRKSRKASDRWGNIIWDVFSSISFSSGFSVFQRCDLTFVATGEPQLHIVAFVPISNWSASLSTYTYNKIINNIYNSKSTWIRK